MYCINAHLQQGSHHQRDEDFSPFLGEKSSLDARLCVLFLACPLWPVGYFSGGRPLYCPLRCLGPDTGGITGYTYTQCPFWLSFFGSNREDFLTVLGPTEDTGLLDWRWLGSGSGQLILFCIPLIDNDLFFHKKDKNPPELGSGSKFNECSFGLLLVNNSPASLWFSVSTVFNSFGKLGIHVPESFGSWSLFFFFFLFLWKSLCCQKTNILEKQKAHVPKQSYEHHYLGIKKAWEILLFHQHFK